MEYSYIVALQYLVMIQTFEIRFTQFSTVIRSGRTFRKLSFLLCLSFLSLGYTRRNQIKPSQVPEARVA